MQPPEASPTGYTVESYLALVDCGVLAPDEPVELLEGLIVSEPAQNPPHATTVGEVADVLREAIGRRAVVRVQAPFRAGSRSLPEPDVAVLPGRQRDYVSAHPDRALLIVEVADRSLQQDRLTKAPIYAAANVPEYWIVNLRDDCVEIFRDPWPKRRRYASTSVAHGDERIQLHAVSKASVVVSSLLPARRRR